MHNYTYTILNTFFFLPVIIVLISLYWRIIKSAWRFIAASGFIGLVYFFIVDIFATNIKAWEYDYTKVLGIRFNFAVLEELIWMVLVFMIVAVVIEIYFARRKKKVIIFESIKGAGKTVLLGELKKLLPHSVLYEEEITLAPVKHSESKDDIVEHYKNILEQIEQADAEYFLFDRFHFTKWPIDSYKKDYFVEVEKLLVDKFESTFIFLYIDDVAILTRLEHTHSQRVLTGWKLNYDGSSIENEAKKDADWQKFFLEHQFRDTLVQNKSKINTTDLHLNLNNLKIYLEQCNLL